MEHLHASTYRDLLDQYFPYLNNNNCSLFWKNILFYSFFCLHFSKKRVLIDLGGFAFNVQRRNCYFPFSLPYLKICCSTSPKSQLRKPKQKKCSLYLTFSNLLVRKWTRQMLIIQKAHVCMLIFFFFCNCLIVYVNMQKKIWWSVKGFKEIIQNHVSLSMWFMLRTWQLFLQLLTRTKLKRSSSSSSGGIGSLGGAGCFFCKNWAGSPIPAVVPAEFSVVSCSRPPAAAFPITNLHK